MIGEDFVQKTFAAIMLQDDKDSYMKTYFDILEFAENKEGNILSRVYNNVVEGLKQEILWNKVVIVALDGDMLRQVEATGEEMTILLNQSIDYLFNTLHELVVDRKIEAPPKSKA